MYLRFASSRLGSSFSSADFQFWLDPKTKQKSQGLQTQSIFIFTITKRGRVIFSRPRKKLPGLAK
jgi:hypothetical protein